jgi:hypothetical protein
MFGPEWSSPFLFFFEEKKNFFFKIIKKEERELEEIPKVGRELFFFWRGLPLNFLCFSRFREVEKPKPLCFFSKLLREACWSAVSPFHNCLKRTGITPKRVL